MATTGRDPWDKKVTVKLPKAPRGEENFVIASVNGRVFKIQRGVEVEVPEPIAEVLRHSEQEQDRADEFIEKMTSDFEEKSKNL